MKLALNARSVQATSIQTTTNPSNVAGSVISEIIGTDWENQPSMSEPRSQEDATRNIGRRSSFHCVLRRAKLSLRPPCQLVTQHDAIGK